MTVRNLRRTVRKEIKEFAKTLRATPTKAEERLWQYLRARRLGGLAFRRQSILRGYIADFYCPSKALIIEVDGPIHEQQISKDRVRDQRIRNLGISTIRFKNEQVFNNISEVLTDIGNACGVSKIAAEILAKRINFPQIHRASQYHKVVLDSFEDKEPKIKETAVPRSTEEISAFLQVKSILDSDLPRPQVLHINSQPVETCQQQVFSSISIAENEARRRSVNGVKAIAEPCSECAHIHVKELP